MTDENVVLTPVRKMAIAEQLSMLNTDEALEITPKSCSLENTLMKEKDKIRFFTISQKTFNSIVS